MAEMLSAIILYALIFDVDICIENKKLSCGLILLATKQHRPRLWLNAKQAMTYHLQPLLLTWFNFNPSMDK